MPKSKTKAKAKSKTKSASSVLPLELHHLYDALIHDIGHTSGVWGPVTLSSDLLPRVISFLDPSEDLATLLVIQRCSTFAWECATPNIYAHVTIVDWAKFLRLPKGLPAPRLKQLGGPRQIIDPAHMRSIQRRRDAFRSIINMTIHAFPLAGDYVAFKHLTWDGRKKTPCPKPGCGDKCDSMFPQLYYLEISERAMEPICHGGLLADRWINNAKSEEYRMDEVCPILLGGNSHIRAGCVMLPQKPEHTMAYGLKQLAEGNMEYGEMSTEEGGRMHVKPPKTEASIVLREVLACFDWGARVSIHNMTDLWIRAACGHPRVTYRLFYSPNSVKVPWDHGGGLRLYRANAYRDALLCEPEHDANPCKDCGHPHFRATWTITGEARCQSSDVRDEAYVESVVDEVCTQLLEKELMDEIGMFYEEQADDPELQGEALAQVAPDMKVKVKRMKFVRPGEEEPCSFCGRF